VKSVITLAATMGLALSSGCAVRPTGLPTCAAVAAPAAAAVAAPAAASAPALAVAASTQRSVYVRPVIPPLPAELYQPSTNRAVFPKPVYYGAELVAAMVETVPDADVFLAGGDTYFWHRDPRGRRERVFYGHGDRRSEIAQRRAGPVSHVAETSKSGN